MFEIIAVILCVITLVLLLTYLYQRKQITKMSEAENTPFPSYDYDYYIGKYCPEGYTYKFVSPGDGIYALPMDICTSEINDTLLQFTPYKAKTWPPKKNDPGLTKRCTWLSNNPTSKWGSISNLCAMINI